MSTTSGQSSSLFVSNISFSQLSSSLRAPYGTSLTVPDVGYVSRGSRYSRSLDSFALSLSSYGSGGPPSAPPNAYAPLNPVLQDEVADYPGMTFFTRTQMFNPICRWALSKGAVHGFSPPALLSPHYSPSAAIKRCPVQQVPLVAFATDEGYLIVFDLKYNRFKYAFKSYVGAFFCCAWSSDGQILAVWLSLSLHFP
jgi:hypothetical protein